MNLRTRVLEPQEYYLVEPLIEEGATPLDPDYSRVIASIDQDSGKVVGFVALQLVLHAEPIVLAPEFRKQGLWRELAEFADGYISTLGVQAVYNQPTHDTARHIAEEIGYVKSDNPLYVKYYQPLEDSNERSNS
jgi:GNAT superfamily N-acetyltransferase